VGTNSLSTVYKPKSVTMMKKIQIYPITQALLAAALFGVSAPLSKALLDEVAPIPMAALLYLGSGFGTWLLTLFQTRDAEAALGHADVPWLLGALLAGGVAAPIVLMFSLQITPAATAALLLNFESIATTLIAALVFRESVGKQTWQSIILIFISSVLLSLDLQNEWAFSVGAVGILAACILWGIDNTFTRNISAKNPLAIVMVKGLGAGTFSLVLALLVKQPLPNIVPFIGALLLGAFSYGVGITIYIHALRGLGAARTGALYSTAPFIGMVFSFILFRETPNVQFVVAFIVMMIGTWLLVNEKHEHAHEHPVMLHEHRHRHDDDHHSHFHTTEAVSVDGVHSHPHQHEAYTHQHAHTPDIHHRHTHP
jgi:drug/metabolite transporter (DMT)-like permease